MNPKLAKFLVQGAFGVGVTFVLGLVVRFEHKIDDKIEAHYDAKSESEEESDPQ